MELTLFTSTNCAYCPIVKNQLETKGVDYHLVNVDDNPELASQLGIMSVPTIVDEEENIFTGLNKSLEKINTL